MAKTMAKILGVVLIVTGVAGFAFPGLLGAQLNPAHNVVHLASGAIAAYLGFAGSLQVARIFDFVFGGVYFLLGVAGFALGSGSEDMLNVANLLHLGTMDHIIHIGAGAAFIAAEAMSTATMKPAHA